MNLARAITDGANDALSKRLRLGTVTGTSGNKVVVTIPGAGSFTCPWLRTPGQNSSTTLQAANDDEVLLLAMGTDPPAFVVVGIVER